MPPFTHIVIVVLIPPVGTSVCKVWIVIPKFNVGSTGVWHGVCLPRKVLNNSFTSAVSGRDYMKCWSIWLSAVEPHLSEGHKGFQVIQGAVH